MRWHRLSASGVTPQVAAPTRPGASHLPHKGVGQQGYDERSHAPMIAAVLVAAVVYIGLIANQEVAEGLAAGRRLDLSESTAGIWQYIREGIVAMLCVYLLAFVGRKKRARLGRISVSPWVILTLVYVGAQLVRGLLDPTIGDAVAVVGLRFLYIASIAASVRYFDAGQRATLLRVLVRLLIVFLCIESAVALWQVIEGRPTLGTTALGARPWGTYASANNLGLAAVGIGLIIALSRVRGRWFWLALCFALTFATGSRTSILAMLAIFIGMLAARWKGRLLLLPIGAIFFYGFYGFSSSQAVSGRVISGEGRLDLWATALAGLGGPVEYLFGNGLGYGSNAATTILGSSSLVGTTVSDSTAVSAILSVGFVGLALFIAAFVVAAKRMAFSRRYVVLGPILLTAFSFNIPELSPINVLLAIAVGVSLTPLEERSDLHTGSRRWRSQSPVRSTGDRSQPPTAALTSSRRGPMRTAASRIVLR